MKDQERTTVKICTKCKLEKNVNDYSKDSAQKSGLSPSCKECCAKAAKARREKLNSRNNIDVPLSKSCVTCNTVKPSKDFGKVKANVDGLAWQCRDCMKIKANARTQKILSMEKVTPNTKRCNKCGETKSSNLFNRNRASISGLSTYCTECERVSAKEQNNRYKLKDKDYDYYKVCSGCKNKKHSSEFNKSDIRRDGTRSECRECGTERTKIDTGIARLNDPEKYLARGAKHAAKRRAAKKTSSTNFRELDTERYDFFMEEIFEHCQEVSAMTGVKHEVDHIIPLQGNKVNGLHIPSNLQVITEKQNRAKYNKF